MTDADRPSIYRLVQVTRCPLRHHAHEVCGHRSREGYPCRRGAKPPSTCPLREQPLLVVVETRP